MPTELGQQLPRFAEALDREAPAISVDEILGRPTVQLDLDGLERPSSDRAGRVNGVRWGDAMPPNGANGERSASIDLAPTAVEPATRRRVGLKIVLAAAAAAVLVVALAAVERVGDERQPADVPPSTVSTPPPAALESPFVGVWSSTDTDGSSQTMEITRSGTDGYDVVIQDESATAACASGASTLTGDGRLASDASLVIARPELTCDDGTVPPIGPPPQTELASFTLDLDTTTGQLVDRFGVVWRRDGSTVDLVVPSTAPASPPITAEPATSGGMWPQSSLDEVRVAQELADAGDPAYVWQVDPNLVEELLFIEGTDELEWAIEEPGKLVDRFLREVLGWEAYVRVHSEGRARNGEYVDLDDQRYLRCVPGRTNPLYPPSAARTPGELCAPTIDDLNYESVRFDLAQPARRGADGVWVVNRWEPAPPFTQLDPAIVEAQARQTLEEFLAARIAGTGAADLVELGEDFGAVPLLYATSAGTPYERYEIELVDGPRWPGDGVTFSARMFADDGATVIEQQFSWTQSFQLRLEEHSTTENGQSIVESSTSSDGEVTVSAPNAWATWLPGKGAGKGGHEQALDVWFGALWRSGPENDFGSGERIEMVDPVAYDAWCAENGGSPLLSAPADATAIAQQLVADPNFETTSPVAARLGGVDAVSIDVALAPGGSACGVGMIVISRWIHGLAPGERLRLYLVDLPDGMSVETLAITVVATEDRFDAVIAETAPIIESIEFHPG